MSPVCHRLFSTEHFISDITDGFYHVLACQLINQVWDPLCGHPMQTTLRLIDLIDTVHPEAFIYSDYTSQASEVQESFLHQYKI